MIYGIVSHDRSPSRLANRVCKRARRKVAYAKMSAERCRDEMKLPSRPERTGRQLAWH